MPPRKHTSPRPDKDDSSVAESIVSAYSSDHHDDTDTSLSTSHRLEAGTGTSVHSRDGMSSNRVVNWVDERLRERHDTHQERTLKVIVFLTLCVGSAAGFLYSVGYIAGVGFHLATISLPLGSLVVIFATIFTYKKPQYARYTGHVMFVALYLAVGAGIVNRVSLNDYVGSCVGPLRGAAASMVTPTLAATIFRSKTPIICYLVASTALMWIPLFFLADDGNQGELYLLAMVLSVINGVIAACMMYMNSVGVSLLRKNVDAVMKIKDARAMAKMEREANAAKTRFVAVMSHEIRNPLTGIILNTEMLTSDGTLSDEAAEYAAGIERASQILLAIVNDVLDVTKIENGNVSLESVPFDLRSVCEYTLQTVAPMAAEKQLEVVLSMDPELPTAVVGDPTRFRQIVHNLVANAIKFITDPGGEVEVSVEYEPIVHAAGTDAAAARRYRFKVRDTGIGISAEGMKKLFREFSQVDESTTREFGGTGLGLFICKELTELMGGSVGVESVVGEGTTFSFDVVLDVDAKGEAKQATSCVRVTDSQLEFHVSIVVQNESLRDLVKMIAEYFFGAAKHVIATYASASRATRSLKEQLSKVPPDNVRHVVIFSAESATDPLMDLCEENPAAVQSAVLAYDNSVGERKELEARGMKRIAQRPIFLKPLCTELAGVIDQFNEIGRKLPSNAKSKGGKRSSAGHLTLTRGKRVPEFVQGKGVELENAPIVLLVDDFQLVRELVRTVVQALGYRTMVAVNGAEALNIVKNNYDDLSCVLMDCEMPVMDGFAATRGIRTFEQEQGIPVGKRLPVCAMTANAMREDVTNCMNQGMDDFMGKPVRRPVLQEKLERWISFRTDGKHATEVRESPEPSKNVPLGDAAKGNGKKSKRRKGVTAAVTPMNAGTSPIMESATGAEQDTASATLTLALTPRDPGDDRTSSSATPEIAPP